MEKKRDPQKERSGRKRIIRWIILGTALLILGAGAYYIHAIVDRPQSFFEQTVSVTTAPAATVAPAIDIQQYLPTGTPADVSVPTPSETATAEPTATPEPVPTPEPTETPEPTAAPTAEPAAGPTATPEPTANPTAEPTATPEPTAEPTATPTAEPTATAEQTSRESAFSGIVNIALFGIDNREDGSSTSGTMPHTDVNMVLAVNFDTKEVSLISLARDVLTTAPGHSGFYKFNGVFNVGGGMEDPEAGFELSCRAFEEWLGGVSIPYYYGVDFQAVIDLVDAIGGIDYDLDIVLYGLDGQILSKEGRQHLDGERVLAYLRMRSTAGGQDYMRTARQREMLVAIFRKLKDEGKFSMIPELLRTMGDNLYTNTTLEQTAALASFARGIDPDSIRTYSIHGGMAEQYLWRYCMIDQQTRLDILKEVYGIDAAPMAVDTRRYERFLYESGFMAIQHLNIAKKLFEEVNGTFPAEAMSEDQNKAYADCWIKFSDLNTAFEEVNQWMLTFWDDAVEFSPEEKERKGTYYQTLTDLEYQLKLSAEAMKTAFDLKTESNWSRNIEDWFGKGGVINEVYVDFR